MSISNAVIKTTNIDDNEFDVETVEAASVSQKDEVKEEYEVSAKSL